MGQDEVTKIKPFFSEIDVHPMYLEHEAVITSDDAAKTRGFELRQGIKAILLTNDNDEWAIVDIPAVKKVAEFLRWSKSKIRMATLEEVLQKTGCELGAVPPFGHKETLPTVVDVSVYDNQESAFNIGLRTISVKIKTEFMRKVFEKVKAKERIFSK